MVAVQRSSPLAAEAKCFKVTVFLHLGWFPEKELGEVSDPEVLMYCDTEFAKRPVYWRR